MLNALEHYLSAGRERDFKKSRNPSTASAVPDPEYSSTVSNINAPTTPSMHADMCSTFVVTLRLTVRLGRNALAVSATGGLSHRNG